MTPTDNPIERDKRDYRLNVEKLEREAEDKLNQDRREAGLRALTHGSLNAEEIQHCRNGQKIQAIKSVRNRTDAGLADSKNFVEAQAAKLGITFPTYYGHSA